MLLPQGDGRRTKFVKEKLPIKKSLQKKNHFNVWFLAIGIFRSVIMNFSFIVSEICFIVELI